MNGTGKELMLPCVKKLSRREKRYYNYLNKGLDDIIRASIDFLQSDEFRKLRRIANVPVHTTIEKNLTRSSPELKKFFDTTEFKDGLNEIIDKNIKDSGVFIEEFYLVGARLGYSQLRTAMQLSNADVHALNYIQQYNFDLIRNLDTELCMGVRNTIFNAVATGQSNYTTAQQLLELPLGPITYTNIRDGKEITTNISPSRRAEMIARTEHARAVNTGTLQSYNNYGVSEVEIITAGDSIVCDDCLDLESNNPYSLEEAQELLPAHPNCYMPDTMIATNYGWKYFYDLRPEDKILSLNPESNCIDFLDYVQLIGHNNIFDFMYHIYNKELDLCITPDHNCFVYQNDEPVFMKPWELDQDSKFLISYNNLNSKEFVCFDDCYVERIEYKGMVYCVELPKYHTLWVKRDGKSSWNGNCRCSYGPVASSIRFNPDAEPVDLTLDNPEPVEF